MKTEQNNILVVSYFIQKISLYEQTVENFEALKEILVDANKLFY